MLFELYMYSHVQNQMHEWSENTSFEVHTFAVINLYINVRISCLLGAL